MRCKIPAQDLSQKLHATLCLYEGLPYYLSVIGGNRISLLTVPGMDEFKTINPSEDDKLDVSTPPLGYVNWTDGVPYYTYRRPIRRSRQGLDARSLGLRQVPLAREDGGNGRMMTPPSERVLTSRPFREMILNTYPTLDDSIKMLRNASTGVNAIAVNRNVAMVINKLGIINVYYKNDLVGYIAPGDFTVQVPSNDKGAIVSKYLSHGLDWQIN